MAYTLIEETLQNIKVKAEELLNLLGKGYSDSDIENGLDEIKQMITLNKSEYRTLVRK